MEYTKCWLEYPRIKNGENRTLTVNSPVGKSALRELTLGVEGLYGMSVKEGGEEADVTLSLDPALPAGGYAL